MVSGGDAFGSIHVDLSIVISSVQSCNKTLLHLLLLIVFTFCCQSLVAANCDGAMSASATSRTGPLSEIDCSATSRRSHNLPLPQKSACATTGHCLWATFAVVAVASGNSNLWHVALGLGGLSPFFVS